MAEVDRPWAGSYTPGVPLDIDVPAESLIDLLESSVTRFAEHVALDFFGATTTYADLGDQVGRAAEGLRRLGIGPGDRVALVLPNCPQHVVAFYAALRLGAVVVEHNPLYTEDEMSFQLRDHRPTAVIVWDKVATMVDRVARAQGTKTVLAVSLLAALPRSKRLALRLPLAKARAARAAMSGPAPCIPRWEALLDGPPLAAGHPRPAPEDTALLQYTGGTTGRPKAAVLTHRNLRANAAQGRAWMPGLVDGREVVYAVLPLFHAYGLTLCLTFSMSIGATLVLLPRFDVDMVLDAMERRPATFLPAVPPIYQRLAAAARERGADLRSIRYAISGAMALPRETAELWEEVTGGLLVEGYGMTETSPVALGNPAGESRRIGTIGVPFPSTDARVVDRHDASRPLPPGEPGELLLGVDHVALVLVVLDHDGSGVPVGVARMIRYPDQPTAADLAVTVLDDWQGRGAATALLAELVRRRPAGVSQVVTTIAADNAAAPALLRRLGATTVTATETPRLDVVVDLAGPPESIEAPTT